MAAKPSSLIQENIKKAKAKEAERMRDDLEKKLKTVNDSISQIESPVRTVPKPLAMDSTSRQKYFEQEK
jgi:hypothetical protein